MRWALSAADEEAVAAWIRRTATHHLKASSEEEGSAAMTTATATSTPTPTTSGDLALFLDIDLAILGARPPDYARYCERVRLEYHQYDDAAFDEDEENDNAADDAGYLDVDAGGMYDDF